MAMILQQTPGIPRGGPNGARGLSRNCFHLLIDFADRGIRGIDLARVRVQQKAMTAGQAPPQGGMQAARKD
jgi:hypothetical protein